MSKQTNAYAELNTKQPAQPSLKGNRNLSPDLYDFGKKNPVRTILTDKKLTGPQKITALVAHCVASGRPLKVDRQTRSALNKLDVGGMDAKRLGLRALGADVVREVNWIGADLSGQNFSGMNLRGINLRRAKLIETKFDSANLENANLVDTEASGASFVKANMTNADVNRMRGENVYVQDAITKNLRGIPNIKAIGMAEGESPFTDNRQKGDVARSFGEKPAYDAAVANVRRRVQAYHQHLTPG